ncbi:tetratricopeptide repeat protein [Arcticibacter sp. MXS-1]|uniref:tetratricopeptide repeat protein n=1 Tax=Arcticibacter sp. MXS-1 TaxID=3341726 RepID=UPI0035A82D46
MRVKRILSAAALFLLAGVNSFASNPDSVSAAARIRSVKIGPVFFDARTVDSAQVRRLLVRERLQKKNKEVQELAKYQSSLLLNKLLNETETSDIPDEKVISTLGLVLEEYERTNDLKNKSLILNTYGVYYGKRGDTEKAITYFNEAYALKERLKDKAGMAKAAENLVALYKNAGNNEKAALFGQNLINLNMASNKIPQAAEGYLSLAETRLLQNKYAEAEYCILKKALPMFTRTGNKPGRLRSFQQLAKIYYTQKRYSEAKWFYVQGHALATRLDNREALVSCLIHLAEVKNALGEPEMAIDDYRKAEVLAVQNNMPVKLIEIKAELGEVYSQLGNYPAAGSALDEYSRLRESLMKSVTL